MGANLIEQLRQVEDFRTLDGRRHPRSVGITVCNNGHYEWICWVSCMGGFRQTASSGIDRDIWNTKTWCSFLLNYTTCNYGSRLTIYLLQYLISGLANTLI